MKKADRFKLWYLSAESYAAEQGIHQHYDKFDFGYASALSYLLLAIVTVVVNLFFRRIRQVYE